MLATGVLGAVAVAVVSRWRQVPAAVAVLAPLLVLLSAAWAFDGITAEVTADQLAERTATLRWHGSALIVVGVVLGVGAGITRRAALAQQAAISAAMGVVMVPWAIGHAALWRAWGQGPQDVLDVQSAVITPVQVGGAVGLLLLVGVWLPAWVVGLKAGRWQAAADGMGAVMVVSLASMFVGNRAGHAVREVVVPWRTTCEQLEAAGVAVPRGPVALRDASAAVVVGPDVLLAELDLAPDALIAGLDAPAEGPWLYRRHPVVATRRCGGWRVSDLRAAGRDGQRLGDVVHGLLAP